MLLLTTLTNQPPYKLAYYLRLFFLSGIFSSLIFSGFSQTDQIDALNQQAYELYRQEVTQAKQMAYKALSMAEEGNHLPQQVDSYVNLGRCFRTEGNNDSTYWALKHALKLGEEIEYEKGLIHVTNNMGAFFMQQQKIDSATIFWQQSLLYAQAYDDLKGQINAWNNLAIAAEMNMDYKTVNIYLNKALKGYEYLKDSAGIARIYANKAYYQEMAGRYDSALIYCMQVLQLQEAMGLSEQQASTYMRMGELYLDMGEKEQALAYYQHAYELYEEIDELGGMTTTRIYIGNVLYDQEQHAQALPYLEEGVNLAKKLGDPLILGAALADLASTHVALNTQLEKAESLYQEAIPLLSGSDYPKLLAIHLNMGKMYLQLRKITQAGKNFEEAFEIAERVQDLKSQATATKELAKIYEKQGNANKALKFIKKHQTLDDSLNNQKAIEKINKLNIEYETERKEKEILELQMELERQEMAIETQRFKRNLWLGIGGVFLLVLIGMFLGRMDREG